MTATEHPTADHAGTQAEGSGAEGAADWLSPSEAGPGALPHPTRSRWQPLRLGLVDLYYYDDEQFWFHDGRLLLRGNNGTGKSKVLALTLPFLLDGSVLPRRVEPDADPKKRMEWNLLLGGAHPNPERTGYAWVEFARLDEDGTEHFCTLGIGLKAAAGRGMVKSWYFTTSRRIGELRLLDDRRTVLTAERLRATLEQDGTGQVFITRESYRRAVDENLFRLGEERYGALVDLLIQLRAPQLSKRPDEQLLSAALTEALAPLDQAIVADVAESFRSLEEERSAIEAVRETLGAADGFLRHYRAYAKVAARRHTSAVRLANSAYDHAGRDLRETETDLAEAEENVGRIEAEQASAEERQSSLTGSAQALRESPEMRDAERLDQAERSATDLASRSGKAAEEAERARSRSQRDAEDAARAQAHHETTAAAREHSAGEAGRLAGAAGLADDHEAITADDGAARRGLQRRQDQVRHVRHLIGTAEKASARASEHHRLLDAAENVAAQRGEAEQTCRAGVDAAVADYSAAVATFLSEVDAIAVEPATGDLVAESHEWAGAMDADPPLRVAVEAAVTSATQELSRNRANAESRAEVLDQQRRDLLERIADLEAGHDLAPAPAPGRDPAARLEAAGEPLWRLTDFAADAPGQDRAGLEAALQSAGLLDAWVFPDGSVAVAGDVVLSPAGAGRAGAPDPAAPAPAAALRTALVPAVGPEADVPEEVVAGVLERVGLGESSGAPLWVDVEGRWGAGPARGRWAKEHAEFIGAGAREAARRSVLDRLQHELAGLERDLEGQHGAIAEVDRRLRLVETDQQQYPHAAERALARAHEQVSAAERESDRARMDLQRTRAEWETRDAEARRAVEELHEQAEELTLGATTAELDESAEAITAYSEALVGLRHAGQTAREAEAALAAAAERATESEDVARSRQDSAHTLRTEAATHRSRADALRETVGASVAQLQDRLAAIDAELTGVAAELKRLAQQLIEANSRRATLQERTRVLSARREEAEAERAQMIDSLRTFAGTGVLRVALPELDVPDPASAPEWTVTAALGLSRTAEQELDGIDETDQAWSRVQQRTSSAHTDLAAQMSRHGHTALMEQHDDVLIARVRYRNEEVDVDQLAGRLTETLTERERLLSAREREILENHLVNEVAGHLHELLLTAQGHIEAMNRELVQRKTSTGMQLRVLWRERTDGPAGLAAARDLMLRSDATWTPEDRAAIGTFLQERIAQIRQEDPAGSWHEHLEHALDYRQWHTFVVERRQNGQWRSASGPASGGERVLAMSVPLFAAAASHYNSAAPDAPRLILLDEAFAGVDDDSRAKSLGLLATFDLDVVMTSEREWGCYPEVPGLAIAQLSRVEGIDAVGVSRWRWDGHRREHADDIDESARAGVAADDTEGQYEETLLG